MISRFLIATPSKANFVDLSVPGWAWIVLLILIGVLLAVDILVIHRKAHVATPKQALIESAVWVSIGLAFTAVIAIAFGGAAAGEYVSGYLIEQSLSVDNVFVWALILSFYKVPLEFQHRVLFWGIFGALALRATFIFAGLALIEKFTWVLYVFGAFLLYTGFKLMFEGDEEMDPSASRLLKIIRKVVPSSTELDGQKFFTRVNARRVATPLFAVLLLVELTDVLFAVDSVPAVLAVSREQFIVFSSNAFAILGLRALYFLFADAHTRFAYLKHGLAVILSFVGLKMLIHEWVNIPTTVSLAIMVLTLAAAVGLSVKAERDNPSASPVD